MAGDAPRLRRGLILAVLYESTHPLALSLLTRQMEPAYTLVTMAQDLERDLAYLEEICAIERSTTRFGGRVIESAKILPMGIDLAERSTEHPGVEIA